MLTITLVQLNAVDEKGDFLISANKIIEDLGIFLTAEYR